jgi:hypothetical protein
MKMLKKLISIILLLALVNTVSAEVSPSEIAVDMIAGDTIAENLTIQGTPGTYMIESKVTPSSVGIKITYSENPIILTTDSKNITMYIESDLRLEPNTYYITSIIYQLKEPEEKIIYKTRTKTVEKIITVVEQCNETECNDTKLLNLIETLLQENENLTQQINDLNNIIRKPNLHKEENFLFLSIILFIIVVFMFLYLLGRKKEAKK